jgi:hypothetical protein
VEKCRLFPVFGVKISYSESASLAEMAIITVFAVFGIFLENPYFEKIKKVL